MYNSIWIRKWILNVTCYEYFIDDFSYLFFENKKKKKILMIRIFIGDFYFDRDHLHNKINLKCGTSFLDCNIFSIKFMFDAANGKGKGFFFANDIII